MKNDNYYKTNNSIKIPFLVNSSYQFHQSQVSSPSSTSTCDKNKITDNNHNKVSPQNTHTNIETVVSPVNPHNQSNKEINQVSHDSNPHKQTLPNSSNKRKRDYLYITSKRIKLVDPITKSKVLSIERNLREPRNFEDIFNLIDKDK